MWPSVGRLRNSGDTLLISVPRGFGPRFPGSNHRPSSFQPRRDVDKAIGVLFNVRMRLWRCQCPCRNAWNAQHTWGVRVLDGLLPYSRMRGANQPEPTTSYQLQSA